MGVRLVHTRAGYHKALREGVCEEMIINRVLFVTGSKVNNK